MPDFRTSPKGIELIKKWEGIVDGDPTTVNLDPYLCPANYWTIGWGHVVRDADGNMLKGLATKNAARAIYPQGITREEAEFLLKNDLRSFEVSVNRHINGSIEATSQNQFDAMLALCFNIGGTNFKNSSVLRFHKANARFSPLSMDIIVSQIKQGRSASNAADAFLLWNKATIDGVLSYMQGLMNRRMDERKLYLDGTI